MPATVEIENIEQMRRERDIDDVELHLAIRDLRVGDVVRLTLRVVTDPGNGETLPVRITRIRGAAYRGVLAAKPTSSALDSLKVGTPLAFTAEHVHSLPVMHAH